MALVRIGTRSSPMALAQVDRVSALLKAHDPEVTVEVVAMTTSGDRWTGPLAELGGKGAFTKEVDSALLGGHCDLAVHCVKDIPADTPLPEGTSIEAFIERDDVRDAVIQPDGIDLADLPEGSRVGTSSPRRAAQLALNWPHVKPVPVRGNANSRLAKLDAGEYDALLLAVAGLERIELTERISQILPVESMVPAVGSGTLALQCRSDDEATIRYAHALRHESTWRRTIAERTMLRVLGGNCHSPIAGYATILPDGALELQGRVIAHDGSTVLDASGRGHDAEALGTDVGAELIRQGAEKIIANSI